MLLTIAPLLLATQPTLPPLQSIQAGTPAGSSPTPRVLRTVTDGPPATRFGAAIAPAGDLDQDGVPDLVVGAPGTSGGAGRVVLLSGADGSEVWTRAGGASDRLGHAVCGPGDLDGDGVGDVVAGAPSAFTAAGQLQALSGVDGSPIWVRAGLAPGERWGHSVAALGDVDGDGHGDLIVGAPYDSALGTYAGRVDILSGAAGIVLHSTHGSAFDQLGLAVAGLGDLDGDGIGDGAVGAPFDDRGGFNAGALIALSGASGARLLDLLGSTPGDWLGHAVAGPGDVDRDGVPDLLVGLPGADALGFDSGAAEVRSGAHGGLLHTVPGEAPGQYLGSVGAPGDVDGDGAADLLVAATAGGTAEAGRVRLVSGRTGAELCRWDGLAGGDWLGASLTGAGDVDGDGRADLAAGAPASDDLVDQRGYVQWLGCVELAAGAPVHPPSRRP